MKICPKCKAENIFETAQFCKDCGSPLVTDSNIDQNNGKETDPDFEVTESTGPSATKFSGNSDEPIEPKKSKEPVDDKIELTSSANVLDMGITDEEISQVRQSNGENTTERFEKSPDVKDEFDFSDLSSGEDEQMKDNSQAAGPKRKKESKIESLQEEPKREEEPKVNWNETKSELDNPSDYAKKSLNDNQPFAQPIPENEFNNLRSNISPDSVDIDDDSIIKKSAKVRGIAYFKNNNIQLAGTPYLHEDDEIIINEKPYLLKQRQINLNSKSTIGLYAAALVIILTVIATQFMRSGDNGNGNIVGVILDEYGRPYLESAQVKLTELDEYTTTDSQGFFKFDDIPTGTYEIAYQLGDQFIGFGTATVTEGQPTLATYSDLESLDEYYAEESSSDPQKKNDTQVAEPQTKATTQSAAKTTSSANKKKTTSSKKSSTKKSSGYGKVKLLANVDDARITVDGKILGSGNNTYSKIKSGTRTIKIDKAGYEIYSEKIKISKGKTRTIEVNLERLASTDQQLTAANYLAMGNDNLKSGDIPEAIEDYTQALKLEPSNLGAYKKRAEAYVSLSNSSAAAKDYIRIGEIERMNGKPSSAIKSFAKALDYSPKNYSALIGRAGSYCDKGEYRMASTDYEIILKKDKNDYQALYGSGLCYFKSGNYKKAEKSFKEAYKINKSDKMLYQYMLLTYMARDNVKKLRKLYAEYKLVASPQEFAEFKSNNRFEPVIRLIKEEDR